MWGNKSSSSAASHASTIIACHARRFGESNRTSPASTSTSQTPDAATRSRSARTSSFDFQSPRPPAMGARKLQYAHLLKHSYVGTTV